MKTTLNHIALQYDNKKEADIFFTDILGIKKIRSFDLTESFSKEIFCSGKSSILVVLIYIKKHSYK